MSRYVIVSASSLRAATEGKDEGEDIDSTTLDILSTGSDALIFEHMHDAEDFMDVADVSVEMVVIEAPSDVTGIFIV